MSRFEVYKCFLNRDWREKGMAQVLVVRAVPEDKYIAGLFLVDVFCLGVKNTFVTAPMNTDELEDFRGRFPEKLHEISYEDARSLILGGIQYAQGLGFKPHPDWKSAQCIVEGGRPFEGKFEYGKDGKPFYVQGPDDDVDRIMRQLGPLIERGEAEYVCGVSQEEWEDGDEDLVWVEDDRS